MDNIRFGDINCKLPRGRIVDKIIKESLEVWGGLGEQGCVIRKQKAAKKGIRKPMGDTVSTFSEEGHDVIDEDDVKERPKY